MDQIRLPPSAVGVRSGITGGARARRVASLIAARRVGAFAVSAGATTDGLPQQRDCGCASSTVPTAAICDLSAGSPTRQLRCECSDNPC
jgi:hypothetical protein